MINIETLILFTINMNKKLIVIGSGPGGYTSAVLAAKKGMDVKLIEKGDLGGVCTNRGCIPSKALLSVAETIDTIEGAKRKGIKASLEEINMGKIQKFKERAVNTSQRGIEKQIKETGVELITGEAKIETDSTVTVNDKVFEADYIIVATGSEPAVLPFLDVDEQNILTSKGALQLTDIPESMVIIGGGYIGMELATVFSSLGTSITVVEMMDRLLPNMDVDISKEAQTMLKRKRIKIHTNTVVKDVKGDGPFEVLIEGDEEALIEADKVLCSIGRSPTPPEMNLDIIDDKGFIETDDFMKTSVDGIYAVGDVNGRSMLAHSAYKQAEIAVKDMIGEETLGFSDYLVPSGVYTHPEFASVGSTQEEAEKEYDDISISKFPMSANGRGYSTGKRAGFAKLIYVDDDILGIHLVCPSATDIIMEGLLAMEGNLGAKKLSDIIHPHPTYSEAIVEALRTG